MSETTSVRQQRGTDRFRTYGCQMNVHDSELLAGLPEAAAFARAPRPQQNWRPSNDPHTSSRSSSPETMRAIY